MTVCVVTAFSVESPQPAVSRASPPHNNKFAALTMLHPVTIPEMVAGHLREHTRIGACAVRRALRRCCYTVGRRGRCHIAWKSP